MLEINDDSFYKLFDSYLAEAREKPITITSEGKPSLVLLPESSYNRLKSMDTREVLLTKDMTEEELRRNLEAWDAEDFPDDEEEPS